VWAGGMGNVRASAAAMAAASGQTVNAQCYWDYMDDVHHRTI
jgi:hypothetical protein